MDRSNTEYAPFSANFQVAVNAELESMLKAPIFTQSNRCKRFLSYVVHQTLAGNAGELKERTIGIGVFDRRNDYDTGDDSIVRVTANEVRKRLGQYYRESPDVHLIQIELPRGSYVPEFRIQPSRQPDLSIKASLSGQLFGEPKLPASLEAEEPLHEMTANPEDGAHDGQIARTAPSTWSAARRRVVYPVIILGLAAITVFGGWIVRNSRKGPDLWGAFLHSEVPILVCIDTHNLAAAQPPSPDDQRFVDIVLRRQALSLDDSAILASMASELGRQGIPFRVAGAEQTSLSDLRRQPVILIGAIDNKWTIRLTQNLRYRIEVKNPPGSGSDKEPVATIIDSQHPATSSWMKDLSVPFTTWKVDYAIVARVDDSTTGVPVLIEAGLGNDGTVAASEWITSGDVTRDLSNEPSCRGKNNFESVIETQLIDTKSGPPHVLRLSCW